jgi:excisionase family DNA binding protein
MPIDEWTVYSTMSRSRTYAAVARGEIRAVKMGRLIRIDTASGDAYLDALPPHVPAA